MKATKYVSTSQQRVLKTMKALFGHEVTGITTNDLSRQLETSSDRVFKDLKNLEEAGLAEQLPNKNWRISPALGRESLHIVNNLNAMARRLDETAKRFGVNEQSQELLRRYGTN